LQLCGKDVGDRNRCGHDALLGYRLHPPGLELAVADLYAD
jgi:hypothetical protein